MNFKTNATKLIAKIMLLVLLLTSVFSFVSCAYITQLIQTSTGGYEVNMFHCSYEIDKEKYDINCVTLLFYYGVGLDMDSEPERSANCPEFELYFQNDEGTSILVKHMEENLISKKYEFTYGPFNKEIYNHSEELTIPKELFTKDSGIIYFYLYGTDLLESSNPAPRIFTSIDIYYKKDGDIITLSKEI